jgi:quercetin dioxygenase-like cupin family protein
MTYVSERLRGEVQVPEQGILSRTLHNGDGLKVVIFGFSAGQELSAHAAPMPAVIQILEGVARVTLGGDVRRLEAGSFVAMPPGLTHAIAAETPLVMLLQLWKGEAPQALRDPGFTTGKPSAQSGQKSGGQA